MYQSQAGQFLEEESIKKTLNECQTLLGYKNPLFLSQKIEEIRNEQFSNIVSSTQ